MKKVLSILLALSLILSIGAAMAADSKGGENIPQTKVTTPAATTTTTSTSSAPAAEPAPTHVQLKMNSAHLRETPAGKYNIANDWIGAGTTLELAGDPVTVDGTTWYPVIYDGKVWYVADYVSDLVVGAGKAPASKKTASSSSSSYGWTSTDTTAQQEEASLTLQLVSDNAETAAIIKAFRDAFAAGDVLSALPDDVKAKLAAGNNVINEMVTAQFVGDTSLVTGSILANVKFDTLYTPAGAKVDVLFAHGGAWTVLTGTVKEDGSIDMTIGKDLISSLKNDPFVLGVVSQ